MRAASTTNSALFHGGDAAAAVFRTEYASEPVVFRAPGRVNLIGEFTDYNDGFVMPAALGFSTYVAIGPRVDRELHVYSVDFDERKTFLLDSPETPHTQSWGNYVWGVAAVLMARGHRLCGANIVIHGNVPIGAGLSSSAALEVATALALLHNSNLSLHSREVALACQQAEHQFAGTLCGIMDQFISCCGRAGYALLLDCRSLDYELLPLAEGCRIVVCNSGVKHDLATGEYNKRRHDCEQAVAFLKHRVPSLRALRDISVPELEQYGRRMGETEFRRARHVVSENERTLAAAASLKSRNMAQFGRLMFESHSSLRDDFEVSCRELDLLVSIASTIDGVFGARMTGGGFGGCTVNVVRNESVDDFQQRVVSGYKSATGIVPKIYVCDAADGAGLTGVGE